MTEKKHGAPEPIPGVKVIATEISVARNRSVEPYIKTFAFSPENVTQEILGALVGAFSVSDRSEASAYTVNVIASVARKEYYANPRRGAIESFESTLHRINLALSELVKNGQTSWMRSLHGTIAVVDKENLHFSATGEGKILLFREGSLSDIGDGLASKEAASHPLKTFLEISSGQLVPNDCVLLATPEPLELFSPRDLERDANRLLPERKFIRFLETAMINDLRTGAIVVLDAREAEPTPEIDTPEKPKRKRTVKPEPVNAWSEETFRKAAEERTKAVLDSYDSEEVTIVSDHMENRPPSSSEIRIQGEVLENVDEHPMITKARWIYEDAVHSFRSGIARSIRDTRRRRAEALDTLSTASPNTDNTETSAEPSVQIELTETTEVLIKESSAPQETSSDGHPSAFSETTSQPTFEETTKETVFLEITDIPARREERSQDEPRRKVASSFASQSFSERSAHVAKLLNKCLSIATDKTGEFLSAYAIPATKTTFRFLGHVTGIVAKKIGAGIVFLWRRFLSFPPKRQLLIATFIAFLLTVFGTVVWKSMPEKKPVALPPVIVETPVVAPFPPINEKNASHATVSPLSATNQDIVTPIFLKNSLYLVTKTGVVDTATGTSYPLPKNSGTVHLASGMKDLGFIFLLTEQGDLYSFAVSNHAFVKNTIPFPTGFKAVSIGSYLTYLYFLEAGTGKVYRYPRADNGFGTGVLWTKTAMSPSTHAISVSENIYGTDGSTLTSFLKGKPSGGFSPENPTSLLTITAICANPDLADRIAILDAPAKRLIIDSGNGMIVSQLFDESLASATSCAINQDGSSVAVSGGTTAETLRIETNR